MNYCILYLWVAYKNVITVIVGESDKFKKGSRSRSKKVSLSSTLYWTDFVPQRLEQAGKQPEVKYTWLFLRKVQMLHQLDASLLQMESLCSCLLHFLVPNRFDGHRLLYVGCPHVILVESQVQLAVSKYTICPAQLRPFPRAFSRTKNGVVTCWELMGCGPGDNNLTYTNVQL